MAAPEKEKFILIARGEKKSKEMCTHVLCQTKLCLESLLNWVNVKTSIFRYLAFLIIIMLQHL